jgi:hypothetical protein
MTEYLKKVKVEVEELINNKVQDLTKGTVQDLKNFDSKNIGKYKLLQNNLEKYPKGYVYINSEKDWTQLSEGNLTFNIFDNTGYNIFKLLKEQLVLNLTKTNFIIIKLENNSKRNYAYFYLNNAPNVIDEKNGIVQFKITKTDFIGSEGSPDLNDTYSLSYMLKDPSNEKIITQLPLLAPSKITIPKNAAQFISDKEKDLLNTKPIQTTIKPVDACDFGEIIKHQNLIVFAIAVLVILFFIK